MTLLAKACILALLALALMACWLRAHPETQIAVCCPYSVPWWFPWGPNLKL
jgi:hypothetical protein